MDVVAVVEDEDRKNLGGNRRDGRGKDTWTSRDEGPGNEDEEEEVVGLNRPEVGARMMNLCKGGDPWLY